MVALRDRLLKTRPQDLWYKNPTTALSCPVGWDLGEYFDLISLPSNVQLVGSSLANPNKKAEGKRDGGLAWGSLEKWQLWYTRPSWKKLEWGWEARKRVISTPWRVGPSGNPSGHSFGGAKEERIAGLGVAREKRQMRNNFFNTWNTYRTIL